MTGRCERAPNARWPRFTLASLRKMRQYSAMKASLLLGCLAAWIALSPVLAGEAPPVPPPWPTWQRGVPLDPTARTHSRSVRVSDACWRTCEMACSWHFRSCATAYWVNDCRAESDACDLSCQKTCRGYGGPLLNITNSGP